VKQISESVSYISETDSEIRFIKNMKIYETDFEIRFILLIRVKRVIIGGTGEGLGVQGEAPYP